MSTLQFLTELKNMGLNLWIEGEDQLCYRAKKGVMTRRLKEQLQARKPHILELLSDTRRLHEGRRPEILPTDGEGDAPLSHYQEQIWQRCKLGCPEEECSVMESWILDGPLDAATLEQALNRLVARHENLRMSFVEIEGKPVARGVPGAVLHLDTIDLTRFEVGDEGLRALLRRFGRVPQDPAHGALLQALLLRIVGGRHVLAVKLHPLVADAWSMGILGHEWTRFYNEGLGKAKPLQPLPSVRYTDYAHWERHQNDRYTEQIAYWKKTLADFKMTPIVGSINEDALQPGALAFAVSADKLVRLRALAESERTSLFMVLLALWNILLHQKGAGNDIAVGSELGQRVLPEMEKLVGPFVNTVVLRNKIDEKACFKELLKAVRTSTLEAYKHGDLPFELMLDQVRPERKPCENPFFQTRMIYLNVPVPRSNPCGLQLEPLTISGFNARTTPLTLVFQEKDGDLLANLEFNGHDFNRHEAKAMVGMYRRLIDTVSRWDNLPLERLISLKEAAEHEGTREGMHFLLAELEGFA